jgi:cell fate (sporulation/competence/biofilm development) regulator YlbF (YheA/YmcA/DUF963 family)
MIATMEIVDILDKSEAIGQMVLQSDIKLAYDKAKHTVETDETAQQLISRFNKIKELYDDVERFGRYHPDYSKIMKEIREAKRDMDMHESIANYKQVETQFQQFLDEISEIIAFSVSKNIKVPKDGALLKDGGCGCGSGSGGCGCRAS